MIEDMCVARNERLVAAKPSMFAHAYKKIKRMTASQQSIIYIYIYRQPWASRNDYERQRNDKLSIDEGNNTLDAAILLDDRLMVSFLSRPVLLRLAHDLAPPARSPIDLQLAWTAIKTRPG